MLSMDSLPEQQLSYPRRLLRHRYSRPAVSTPEFLSGPNSGKRRRDLA
jgi:hypothetical protein